MLLAIDVGNTSTTLGLFQGERLIAQGRVPTHRLSSTAGLPAFLKQKSAWRRKEISGVIISSVVPQATGVLVQALRRLVRLQPIVLGRTVKAPIVNRYRLPSQVGQDRLCNAVAAFHLYGAPAIVVDFGTAITIDLVSSRQEYLGGVIVPGVEIALEALVSKAALLPRIKLRFPKQLLGKDTVHSMQSGIFLGYSALCDGIVKEMRSQYAPSAKVIATGGYANLIAPHCRTVQIINPQLTLQGLALIYKKSCVKGF